jgi:hypothetical protein
MLAQQGMFRVISCSEIVMGAKYAAEEERQTNVYSGGMVCCCTGAPRMELGGVAADADCCISLRPSRRPSKLWSLPPS